MRNGPNTDTSSLFQRRRLFERRRQGAVRGLVALLLSLSAAGCEPAPAAGCEPAPAAGGPLAGASPSLESLAATVVDALSAADTAALQRLRLTEREHNEIIFPRLPASRPPGSFPVDLAWGNIETRNAVAVSRLLRRWAGTGMRLESVECRGPTERFEGFEVRTDCWVTMGDGQGERAARQLFRHVLDWNGRYKVFRYHD